MKQEVVFTNDSTFTLPQGTAHLTLSENNNVLSFTMSGQIVVNTGSMVLNDSKTSDQSMEDGKVYFDLGRDIAIQNANDGKIHSSGSASTFFQLFMHSDARKKDLSLFELMEKVNLLMEKIKAERNI